MTEDAGKVKEVIELSEEEVAQRSQTLAAKTIEREIAKNDLKEASSTARAHIKALEATINELADQVKTKQMTRYVDRQPGLPFDGEGEKEDEDDEEANPTDGDGEEGTSAESDGEPAGAIAADAKWSEGANPAPAPGTEITDPAAVMGPALPPPEGKGKGRGKHVAH
jgi:hypothetical protein